MRSKLILSLALGTMLGLQSDPAMAQDGAVAPVLAEHRYRFALNSELSEYTEKLFLESMLGFDTNMKVAIDRSEHYMKVLTYVPVDPQAIVSLASQFGVTLVPRRVITEHDGTYMIQD
ncbi:MAG: hypothetical protein KA941_13390 [Flavobacteriales bacterium]|nr:hypothetical protein [Flavobacteriales bacterium]